MLTKASSLVLCLHWAAGCESNALFILLGVVNAAACMAICSVFIKLARVVAQILAFCSSRAGVIALSNVLVAVNTASCMATCSVCAEGLPGQLLRSFAGLLQQGRRDSPVQGCISCTIPPAGHSRRWCRAALVMSHGTKHCLCRQNCWLSSQDDLHQ